MADKPHVFLETSFISYLAAPTSHDLITAQRQVASLDWWETRRHDFALRTSPAVVLECTRGNEASAARRLTYINEAVLLPEAPEIQELMVVLLVPRGPLPLKATADALHVATATFYACEYLLTWNFRHIANAQIRRSMDNVLRSEGYEPSVICTPDELLA